MDPSIMSALSGGAPQGHRAMPPPGAAGIVPTAAHPGGDPAGGDPLEQEFIVAIGMLDHFANKAKSIDPGLANEIDSIKNKLTRRQIKRNDLIGKARKETGKAIGYGV